MKNNRIYTIVNPALNLKILRAELTDTTIDTYLSKDGIQQDAINKFPYSEINDINISLQDFNKNEICIKMNTGKNLSLIA